MQVALFPAEQAIQQKVPTAINMVHGATSNAPQVGELSHRKICILLEDIGMIISETCKQHNMQSAEVRATLPGMIELTHTRTAIQSAKLEQKAVLEVLIVEAIYGNHVYEAARCQVKVKQ